MTTDHLVGNTNMSIQTPASTASLRLFTSPSAFPNPQRLRIFLHEKGIADQFDEQVYNMSPVGEQRQWKQQRPDGWDLAERAQA